eukprot:TRINITY_DN1545_c0_g2_i1.p1 TRINITY_DN1545_c0_g2~~TRINITY_DN1545_c0_g2_i1.p1  ORF type:complete len:419 (+),score=78.54 TRINITY_DN1545_c0_g2_i1:101-1258(+)
MEKEQEAKAKSALPCLGESERQQVMKKLLDSVRERENARMASSLHSIRESREVGTTKKARGPWGGSDAEKIKEVRERQKKAEEAERQRRGTLEARLRTNSMAYRAGCDNKQLDGESERPVKALDPNEILLVVRLRHPEKDTLAQELIVCASQPLTALRDAIYCLHDMAAADMQRSQPSAFFCIENVFYNDMRNSHAKDYSEPILRQNLQQRMQADGALPSCSTPPLSSGGRGTKRKGKGRTAGGDGSGIADLFSGTPPPRYTSRKMEETKFGDLDLRVGALYAYVHQVACRHAMEIVDIRKAHPTDVQDEALYPLTTFQPWVRHRKCLICGIFAAHKVVYNDELMPETPAFLCLDCYHMAHYSSSTPGTGRLVYDNFSVFDYYHD